MTHFRSHIAPGSFGRSQGDCCAGPQLVRDSKKAIAGLTANESKKSFYGITAMSCTWLRGPGEILRHALSRLRATNGRLSGAVNAGSDRCRPRSLRLRRAFRFFGLAALVCIRAVHAAHGQTAFPETAVGASSNPQTITVIAQATGAVNGVSVLTLGQSGLDFNPTVSGTNSCANASFSTAGTSSCQIEITFSPKYPGVRNGAIVLTGSGGNVLATQYLTGTGQGSLGVMVPGTMQTAVGTGQWTEVNDGGSPLAADLDLPSSVAVDGAGNLYIADSAHNRIREVYAGTTPTIETICGTGTPGYTGDGQLALNATLNTPRSVALDGAGNLYIADSGNNAIREINKATGDITTIAGNGIPADLDGNAAPVELNNPLGVTVDAAGDVYIADTGDQRILEVAPSSGNAITKAGDGIAGFAGDGGAAKLAELNLPYAVAFDGAGNMYIPDSGNNCIRVVSAGTIETFAGGCHSGTGDFAGDGGAPANASFFAPSAVLVDAAGNLYIGDTQNNRIRKVTTVSGQLQINTIAGTGAGIYGGDGGSATAAGIFGPYGLTLDGQGDLFIADYFDHRIREVQSGTVTLTFDSLREDQVSPAQIQAIENDGNAAMTLTAITPDSNAQIGTTTNACSTTASVIIDGTCNVAAEFAPTEVGDPITGNIDLGVTGNPANGPLDIQVTGDALALNSTTTALIAGPNPANFGVQVTLSATVTTGTGTLGGSVNFKDGANVLGTVNLTVPASPGTTGTASFTTSALTVGTHSLTAVYNGDDGVHSASTSPAVSEDIQEPTSVAVTSGENPSVSGDSVTFTATVSATPDGGAAPTGMVNFLSGGTSIGSGTLSGNTASFTYSGLTAGTHSITAAYVGDSDNVGSTSPQLSQVVKAITSTSIQSSENPASFGDSVTFTATVSNGSPTPTGIVTFTDAANGNALLGSGSLGKVNTAFVATLSTSALSVASHSIVATYSGDSNNVGSASTGLAETVQKASTTTSLSSSLTPSASGQSVSFTVTVHGGTTAPTGTVSLLDGVSSIVSTMNLGANGTVVIPLSTLTVGTHSLTAMYSGDGNYLTSTSPAISQKVLPNTTAILSSSANPSIAGTNVSITVTVSGASGTPTGNVNLSDGATPLATLTLAGGVANFQTTSLVVGSHSLTAVYGGDPNNAGVTSGAYVQTVNQATTDTTVGASANPATAGRTVSLIATVTGNGATPGGQVRFFSQGTQVGTATLSGGTASLPISSLAVGSDSIYATYAGDPNDAGSTSSTYALSVVQATSSVNLTSSQNPSVAVRAVGFTATVTGSGVTPTGNVIFSDGGTPLATIALTPTGVANYVTSSLAPGPHTITAAYQGDGNNTGSSTSLLQTVTQAAPTLGLTSNLNPSSTGASVTFTATPTGAAGTPSGSVLFNDGGAPIGTASLSPQGAAAFSTSSLSVGQHTITASYGGDANNTGAVSAPLMQTVQETTTTSLASSKNPSIGGTPVTLTATVLGASPGAISGSVTFKSGNSVVGAATLSAAGVASLTTSALAVGSDALTAVYSGDALHIASTSAELTQTVQSAGTTTTLASNQNPSLFGQNVTFTATVSGNGIVPTGAITFVDGSTPLATVNVNTAGVASYSTTTLSIGVHQIIASYSGDSDDQKSTSAVVNQAVQSQTSIVLASSLNPALAAVPVTFTATVTNGNGTVPTGTVTINDGSSVLAELTLPANGTVSFTTSTLPVGTHSITAAYGGDTDDASAKSSTLAQVIQAIPTKTTLGASAAAVTTQQPLTLVASVFSAGAAPLTGTVTFENGTTAIGSATLTSAGTATLTPTLTTGNYNIVAVYSGDANNAVSTSVPVSVTVTEPIDFQMSLNPPAVTVVTKQYTTVTLTITSTDGFTDQLGLGCGSLPASITCNFSQQMVTLPANGSVTAQVTIDTASPLTSGGSAKNEMPGGSSSTQLAWIFPGGALFGLVWWRARKKYSGLFCTLLLILLSAAAFAVTGCGVKTGMDHAVDVTVTVNQ
jgi:hypothetical protein